MNSTGSFTSLLRENMRQILPVLKFKCGLFSSPNSWSLVMFLRLYGQGLEMFSNVYSLILLRKAISKKFDNSENRGNGGTFPPLACHQKLVWSSVFFSFLNLNWRLITFKMIIVFPRFLFIPKSLRIKNMSSGPTLSGQGCGSAWRGTLKWDDVQGWCDVSRPYCQYTQSPIPCLKEWFQTRVHKQVRLFPLYLNSSQILATLRDSVWDSITYLKLGFS